MTRYGYAATERVVPLTKANDPDWHLDPMNLSQLWRWLRERGQEPEDPAYFMEKAWHYSEEWIAMWADLTERGEA